MRIVARLRLLAFAPLLLIVLVTLVAAVTARNLNEAYARNEVAQSMVDDIFDLGILSYDYLSHFGERARVQWTHKFRELGDAINEGKLRGGDPPALRNIEAVHKDLGRTFMEISTYSARRGAVDTDAFREWETHLGTKLLIQRQQGFALAREWEAETAADIQRQYGRLFASTAASFFALALFLAVLAYKTGTEVARGLQQLRAGASAISEGRLDFRLEEGGRDELVELARAFNRLSASLGASFVSIARLEAEIGQRKRAEAGLLESEQRLLARSSELEALNRELEEFSYSISHDMRTPLRAIDGFAQLLAREYASRLDAEGLRLLQVVRGNTARLSQLIDDILAYTRTGRMALSWTRVDMHALVELVWSEKRSVAVNRDIEFVLHPLPVAEGDRGMLRHAIINLLDNAIKFTRPKAHARIEVGAQEADREHIYYVKDNGVGFDPRFAGKLFGTFQRLHAVDEFEGTGIGLAIVKRIVTRHGGRVWAEGSLGEGAAFFFSLPGESAHG